MNLHRSLDKPDWKEVPTLRRTSLQHVAAVSFGVLTTDNIEQAVERAGTKAGNKGVDAAMAAIEMADLLKNI